MSVSLLLHIFVLGEVAFATFITNNRYIFGKNSMIIKINPLFCLENICASAFPLNSPVCWISFPLLYFLMCCYEPAISKRFPI